MEARNRRTRSRTRQRHTPGELGGANGRLPGPLGGASGRPRAPAPKTGPDPRPPWQRDLRRSGGRLDHAGRLWAQDRRRHSSLVEEKALVEEAPCVSGVKVQALFF